MRAKTIQILWHDKQPIFSMDFNGKENILATCGGSIVRIWSVGESVEYLQTLDRHQSTVNTVRFHDELLASGGDDGTIIIWERTDEFKVKGVLRGPSDCYDLCWSPDGKKIASAGIDATIRIYDTTENKCLFVLSQHQHFVQGVAWDPLNRFLASQSSDRAFHLYQIDSQKPKLLQKFVKLESKLYQDEDLNSFFRRLSFSPDGSLLVTVAGISPDQESFCAYVYDRNAFGGGPTMVLPGHKKSIIATRFNPMRFKSTKSRVKFVFAVATFDSVVLYDTDHDKPIASISNLHYATLTDLAWNYDGTMLFMSSTDGFCSMVEFGLNELGELLPREEWPVMEVQQDKDVKEAVKEPVKEVAAKVSPIKKTLEAPVVQKKRIVPTFLGTSV